MTAVEPERENGLVELVDRLLNKGLILNADLIITVAGVPLIGISLKAALASIETMLDYGMMEAWDQDIRDWYAKDAAAREAALLAEGETVLLRAAGSILTGNGDFRMLRPGFWYLTDRRLFLRSGEGMAFEAPLTAIETLALESEWHMQKARSVLVLGCAGGEHRIFAEDLAGLMEAIEAASATGRARMMTQEAAQPF